jgi:hypothetical protein
MLKIVCWGWICSIPLRKQHPIRYVVVLTMRYTAAASPWLHLPLSLLAAEVRTPRYDDVCLPQPEPLAAAAARRATL